MKIFFAPLQGYTEDVYRRLHHEIFGGVDAYYTPFIRLEHGEVRSKDMRDIRPDFNTGMDIIPQIITSGGTETEQLIQKVSSFGYRRIDINMGCPFPLQTRHGKGAGLLPFPHKVSEIAEVIGQHPDITFSVKMRLGLNDADEWRKILPLLNSAPLESITLHPRTASQQYKGTLHMDAFDAFLKESAHPVIYNGEIRTTDDLTRLEDRYGDRIMGAMVGRGMLARPSLASEYKDGTIMSQRELISKIQLLHSRLQEHYQTIIPGESQQLNKLRTFWDYMEPTIGRKPWKKIMKAGNAKNYFLAVGEVG